MTCTFTGAVDGFTRSGTVPPFTTSLVNGTLTRSSDMVRRFANLVPNFVTSSGGYVRMIFTYEGNRMLSGNGIVTTPEPSALEGLLLGTAVFSLDGITRRRLMLET